MSKAREDPFATLRLLGIVERIPNNLPAQPTPLVGREQELNTAQELILRDDVRLVTFTGSGGTGKTRLAVELAATVLNNFPSGVFVVFLAPIKEPTFVLPTIASSLGLKEAEGRPIDQTLKEHLRDRRTLLVLDNFEQVLAASSTVSELLRECPELKTLVTSRIPLHIRGEHELPVLPLALPDPKKLLSVEMTLSYPAITLFVQRAQAVRPDFVVTPENASPIAQICVRLDGLPLALELAAAQIRIMLPAVMLQRMKKRLEFLTDGAQDLPPRQRTLRNTIAWSFDLLDPMVKKTFRRVSVFAGSFSAHAAETVCGGPPDPAQDILHCLTKLVEGSLLNRVDAEDEIRFRMLETIREFAFEALAASDEVKSTLERFIEFYLSLSERSEPELRGPKQAAWLTRLDCEHDNLAAALHWSLENNDMNRCLRFCSALWRFWSIRGHLTEGRTWQTRVLSSSNSVNQPMRAKALLGAGALAAIQDDPSTARTLLHESLNLSRKLGDEETTAFAMNSLALVARSQGDFDEGRRFHAESLAILQKLQSKWGIALVLNNLGVGARGQGDFEEARKLHEQSLGLFRELGDKRYVASSLFNLGMILERKRNYAAARGLLNESLALSRELGDKKGIAESLLVLGSVARRQNDREASRNFLAESLRLSFDIGSKQGITSCLEEFAGLACIDGDAKRMTKLLGAAEALRDAMHAPILPAYHADHEHDISVARSALGEEAFAVEWTQGRTLTLEQAITYALATKT